MRDYGQRYCPIARASELFAERWTPIIVRNLLLGCRTFGQILDGAPGIPRSILTQRLRDLERLGIVDREPSARGRGSTYTLTAAGRDLQAVCDALGTWGARWLDEAPVDIDPGHLLWAIAKSMRRDALPAGRVVVRFDLGRRARFWMLVQRPEPELCRKNPGFGEDLIVSADPGTLADWHMGHLSLRAARTDARIRIEGPPPLIREFAGWGGQTPFAPRRSRARTGS